MEGGTQSVPSGTLEDVTGQPQQSTVQETPWWFQAALAGTAQAVENAQDLTPEQRMQLAEAACQLYAAVAGPTPEQAQRFAQSLAAALFAGGSAAAAAAGTPRLQGFAAIAAAELLAMMLATPPPPRP